MKKGSITVFLSLILVLLFSFLLTTLEAARIRGANAYVSMITELAGDSFLGKYYYPLFQNYRLFGVNAGDDEGFFSEEVLERSLEENITYGLEGLSGGLLQFQNIRVDQLTYETMLSEGEKEFLSQIRQQTVLDGLSLMLQELFSEELFTEAGVVCEVCKEQEVALEATATVTKELIKLMELVDGICMKSDGIAFDKNGKMQANSFFIKQLVPMEQEEVKALFNNAEVFRVVSDKFYRADRAAGRIQNLLTELGRFDMKIEESQKRISGYKNSLEGLKERLEEGKKSGSLSEKELSELQKEIEALNASMEQESESLKGLEEQRKSVFLNAEGQYNILQNKMQGVRALLTDALSIVSRLEKKQEAAKVTVSAYNSFLDGVKTQLSEEVYQVFLKELETMKLYAGLEENGFAASTMRQSLRSNQILLGELSLAGFSEENLGNVAGEMEKIMRRMREYTVDGLWFVYGDIVVAEQSWENVAGLLKEFLTTGILALVGIPKENQSDCSLSGKELPSAGLETGSILDEWQDCIDEVQELFQSGGMGALLNAAGNTLLDGTALELYDMKYFHCYGEESSYTKLKYEREYIIFGAEKDTSNLLSMVLHLIAIRTLLCMVMLLKQPDRVAQLDTISAGVAGFTGMPVLAAVVKYSVLMLWSVEEALVEVAALLQGKRIAVVGMGTVELGELLTMNRTAIAEKAKKIPNGVGAAYQDYLTLLALTKSTREKAYRTMDLIQENIRYRYNDSFRIRNVVTQVSFYTKAELEVLFHTGVFSETVYELTSREERAY